MKLGKPSKRSRRRADKARQRDRKRRHLIGTVIASMGNVAEALAAERSNK